MKVYCEASLPTISGNARFKIFHHRGDYAFKTFCCAFRY